MSPQTSAEPKTDTRRSASGTNWPFSYTVRRLPISLRSWRAASYQGPQRAAARAWRRFGKGRHPAEQNLGDCFSYPLAEAVSESLPFKGEDLARTDIDAA